MRPSGHRKYDGLSPVLFNVYLTAALCDLRAVLPDRPVEDADFPLHTAYAHDVDFLSQSRTFLNMIETTAPNKLSEWFLIVNNTNTERITLTRCDDKNDEEWRLIKKL